MPYHLYKIFPHKKLEKIDIRDQYRDARELAKTLRKQLTPEDGYTIKMVFAKNPEEAERLLTEEREPVPMGDD